MDFQETLLEHTRCTVFAVSWSINYLQFIRPDRELFISYICFPFIKITMYFFLITSIVLHINIKNVCHMLRGSLKIPILSLVEMLCILVLSDYKVDPLFCCKYVHGKCQNAMKVYEVN